MKGSRLKRMAFVALCGLVFPVSNATAEEDTYHRRSLEMASGDVMYGNSPSGSNIYEVLDHRFAPTVSIVNPTTDFFVRVFAVHPHTGVMYIASNRDLYEFDPATQQARLIGETGEYLGAMAFSPEGILYASTTRRLYTVDYRTATATSINPIRSLDLSFHPNGQLWGTNSSRLYRVDRVTGATSEIGRIRNADGNISVDGSAIDSEGKMYAIGRQNGLDSMYLVNLATGLATRISTVRGLLDVRGNRSLDILWGRDGGGDPGTGQTSNCEADATTLCLNAGRFRVTAKWGSPNGLVSARAESITEDTGYFFFNDPRNIEFFAKVLNGCGLNQHYWVFTGGMTDRRIEMLVEDTTTGQRWSQFNQNAVPFLTQNDTSAFRSCP